MMKNESLPKPFKFINVCKTTMHDEDDLIHDVEDSSENEHVTEIE